MNLDDVIPNPQYRMCHSRAVAAPPSVVWDELHRVTMSALPLSWALEAVRLLPAQLTGKQHQPLAGRSFLDITPIPVLFSERPDAVISAGLSQAWRLFGRPDTAGPRRSGSPRLVATGMDQGRDGVSTRTDPAGHTTADRDPRPINRPEEPAALRGLLVLHPAERQRDSRRSAENRRAPRGIQAWKESKRVGIAAEYHADTEAGAILDWSGTCLSPEARTRRTADGSVGPKLGVLAEDPEAASTGAVTTALSQHCRNRRLTRQRTVGRAGKRAIAWESAAPRTRRASCA